MNITAIIPARGGSEGIPKKNIVGLCGKPLIAWTIECAIKSSRICEVYVSTDDSEIARVAEAYGAQIIKRPSNLATAVSSSEEALLHAIDQIEKKQQIDLVVFLQATCPLREPEDIDNAIEKFLSEDVDSLFSGSLLDCFCAWKVTDNAFESVTYDYKNRAMRQAREPYYQENGSFFIFRPVLIKKEHNRLGGKICCYEMPLYKSFDIDTLEDLEVCGYFMKRIGLSKGP